MKAGDSIGSYQLDACLGHASTGAWRVKHMVSNQVFRMDIWPIESKAAEYVRSMKQVAGFRHPHASAILEFGVHEQKHGWALSQFPKSNSLAASVKSEGQPDKKKALSLCFGIARALEMAHDRGVVHGRLSADYVFEDSEKVVLVGWGLVVSEGQLPAYRQKDLDAFAQLVREITPAPPAPVRALLDSPPKTIGAYRRALSASLGALSLVSNRTLVASGPRTDPPPNLDDTMESVLPNLELQKKLIAQTERSLDTKKIDPIGLTGEHIPEDTIQEFSSMKPIASAPNWLDVSRDEVKHSNQYDKKSQEDGWGIEMPEEGPTGGLPPVTTGPKVHTLDVSESARTRPSSNSTRWSKAGWLIPLLVGLALVIYFTNVSRPAQDRPPASTEQVSTQNEGSAIGNQTVSSNATETQSASVRTDGRVALVSDGGLAKTDEADTTTGPSILRMVEFTFFPHEVTVTRQHDTTVICKDSTACALPVYVRPEVTIDTNYAVSCSGCVPHVLEGQTIYDRRKRDSDRRVVMRKKSKAPPPRQKRRSKRR